MIPQAAIQRTILNKLEKYTGCTCVPSNTTHKMPQYPYISFTVINTEPRKGTYSTEDGKIMFMPTLQKWSLTVQSDKDNEALEKAMLIVDFFSVAGCQELADNGIVVADVGAITSRDNLLTIEYEYRKGLDITLRLNNIIENETETIDRAVLNDSIEI